MYSKNVYKLLRFYILQKYLPVTSADIHDKNGCQHFSLLSTQDEFLKERKR